MRRNFWETEWNSRWTAYHLYGMIAATQSPVPAINAYEHAENLLTGGINLEYDRDRENIPRSVMAQSNQGTVVAISGAQTLYMIQGLLDGYSRPPLNISLGGVNSFVGTLAETWARSLSASTGGNTPILLGGYSYGSVVAWGIYAFLRQLNPSQDVRLMTFGGPKPGAGQLSQLFGHSRTEKVVQWTNDNDPVPFVYPSVEQGPNVHALVSPLISRNQNAYQNVYWFQQLSNGGRTVTEVENPTNTTGNPEEAILRWITGQDSWNEPGHHWTTYLQRLYVASRLSAPREQPTSPDQIRSIEAAIASTLTANPPQPNQPPIYSPGDPVVAIAPSPIPAGARKGATTGFSVTWNGIVIATFKTRSRARGLRNTLKRLATSVRRSERFETDALSDAVDLNLALESQGLPTSLL